MQLCWEPNMFNIVYEGNCLQVVTAAANLLPRNDAIDLILFDIHWMLEGAQKWSISHTPRQANQAAHGLAKLACNMSNDVVWMEDAPTSILAVILEDKLCIDLFNE